MHIYLNELVKVFCKKSTIAIFIVLIILNAALLLINENRQNEFYSAQAYRSAFEDLKDMDTQEAYDKIKDQCDKLYLCELMSFGEDITDMLDSYPNIDSAELMQEYESGDYITYTDNIFSEQELLNDVLSEIQPVAEYDEYLASIDETAKRMTSISLFADPDSFSYKNIEKTPDDFAHLKGSVLKISPSKGISMATDFLPTDLIALFMIMTVVVTMVTREKELNQILLSRTTYKGRKSLGAAKLIVCFTAAFIALTLLYSVNLAEGCFTYGFGDLSRQIQSVYGFNESSLKITVLEYFVLFLTSKLLVYMIFAALIYLLSVVFSSSVKVYSALFIIIAAESVLYYTIESSSYLSLLKHINILAYANTIDIFSKYLNLNIFSYPINIIPVFLVSALLLIILLSTLSIIVFDKKSVLRAKSRHNYLTRLNPFKGRSTSLILHECYKIFIGGKAGIILLAFLIITIVTYKPMSETFSNADEIYYKQYMVKLEGEYTEQKQEEIDAEEERFSEIENKMNEELLSSDSDGVFIMMKYQDELAPQLAFEEVKAHAEYLKTTENGEFVYDSGYKLLTGDESAANKDLTLALTAVAMLICCLTYVYSVEYQTGASVLLKTSKRGRQTTFFIKLVIGLLITAIVFIITYAPYFYNALSTYGTAQIDAPLCSLEAFADANISIKSYLILISVGRFVGLILCMLIIYFLSSRLKSFISTLLASTAILILPILLSLLGLDIFNLVLVTPLLVGNL
ncbi:MAG: hypothetical protein LUI06_09455 [Ruminococcus sp.]|nr:hypothetical protein [Ruminococcus sp.]